MKTKLLMKSLLVAAGLCVGMSAWAALATETYDFTLSSHQGNFSYSNSHFDYSTGTWGYMVTNDWLNNRFSFADGTSSGNHRNYWQIRTFKKNNENCTGLNYTQSTKRPFGIHNLKNGDVVVFNNTSAATAKLQSLSTNLKKEGESGVLAAEAEIEFGTRYEVVTSDATTIAEVYGVQYCCVTSIQIITTEDETISSPKISYSVSGKNRLVSIDKGVSNSFGSNVMTYYTTDGTNPTSSSNLYTEPFTISKTTTIKAISVAIGGTVSSVESVEIEAGVEVQLEIPTIIRTSATSVTITSDQSGVIGAPTPTIHYTYGDESDTFEGSKVLTITKDATITAYASATGYADSETATPLAVAPYPLVELENVSRITYTNGDLDTSKPYVGHQTTYYPLVLDNNQWGSIVYFQPKDDAKGGWNFRNNNTWYNNSAGSAFCWMLLKGLHKGDVVSVAILEGAVATYNATYSAKYSYSGHHAYIADADGDVELRFARTSTKGNNIFSGVEAYSSIVSATIGTAGYATYSNANYALDFTGMTVKAYKATLTSDNTVLLTPVTKVPAGEGVLLAGAADDYNVPVIASADALTGNLLKASSDAEIAASDATSGVYHYVLANGSKGVGFYNLAAAKNIGAGKAYLETSTALATSSGARVAWIFADGEATGISSAKISQSTEQVYDLQGRRVAQPTKGLYIVNGKKVIIK